MALARLILVSIFAAVAGCALSSVVLFGSVDRFSFIPLIFALPASVLLLATTYAALAERGHAMIARYAVLIGVGVVGGGLILGFISRGEDAAIGSVYGLATAASWVVLHAITRPRTRHLVEKVTS